MKLTLKNDFSALFDLSESIRSFGKENNVPASTVTLLNLSLDELVTNIISYAWDDDEEHLIQVEIQRKNETVIATIQDDGKAFNPFEDAQPPDLTSSIEQRKTGGLGVHFVKETMSNWKYFRENKYNIVTLEKEIT